MENLQMCPNLLANSAEPSSDTCEANVNSNIHPKTCWFCGTTNVFGTPNAVLSNQAKKLLTDSKLYMDPVLKSLGVVATETIKDCIQVNTFCRPCLELLSSVWATFDELQRLESVLATLRAECKTAIFSSFYRLGGEDPHHYARGYLLGQLEISEQKFNTANVREPWGSTDGNAYAEQQRASSSATAQTSDSYGNINSMEKDPFGGNMGEEEVTTELPSAPEFDALSCLIQNAGSAENVDPASGSDTVASTSFGLYPLMRSVSERTISASWEEGIQQNQVRMQSLQKKVSFQIAESRRNSVVMAAENADDNNNMEELEDRPSSLERIPHSSWREGDTRLSRPNTFSTIFNCPEKKHEYLTLRRKYERLYQRYGIQEIMVNVPSAYSKDIYCPRLGCNQIFQRKFDMECHVRHCHSEAAHPDTNAYVCKVCDFGCGDGIQLKSHMRHHHKPVECDICMTQVEGMFALKNHREQHPENSQHSAQQIVECPPCGKLFRRNAFYVHKASAHMGDSKAFVGNKTRSYSCRICQRYFYTRQRYNAHMDLHYKPLKSSTNQNVEPGTSKPEKPYNCTVCGNSFKTYASLYSHKTKYHKNSTEITRKASTSTSVRPLGTKNRIRNRPIVARCRNCFSVFTDAQMFEQHKCSNDVSTPGTPKDSDVRVFRQCSKCLKDFYNFASWFQHKSREECLQVVPANKNNLPNSMRRGLLNRPTQCPGCKRIFSTYSTWYYHKRKSPCRIRFQGSGANGPYVQNSVDSRY